MRQGDLQPVAVAIGNAVGALELQAIHGADTLPHLGIGRTRITSAGIDEQPPGTTGETTQGGQARLSGGPVAPHAETDGVNRHRRLAEPLFDLFGSHAARGVILAIAQDHHRPPRGQVPPGLLT